MRTLATVLAAAFAVSAPSLALASDPTVGTLPIAYEDTNGFGTFWWNQGRILNFEPITSAADINGFFGVHSEDWSVASDGAIDFARQFADCLTDPGAPSNLIVPVWRSSVDYALGALAISKDLEDGIPNDPAAYALVAKGYTGFATWLPLVDSDYDDAAAIFSEAANDMLALGEMADYGSDPTVGTLPLAFLETLMAHGHLLETISDEIRQETAVATGTGGPMTHPFLGTTTLQSDVDIWFSVGGPQLYAQGITIAGVYNPNVAVYTELFQSNRTTKTTCRTARYASEWDRFFGISGAPVINSISGSSSSTQAFGSDPTVGTLPLISGPGANGFPDHFGDPTDC